MNNNNISKKYNQLTIEEREKIMILKNEGFNESEIAFKINRNQSTISRELSRNSALLYTCCYSSIQAQKRHDERKYISHLRTRIPNIELQNYIEKQLRNYLSPELISGRIKLDNSKLSISHESIYMWIYTDRRDLIKYLWYQRKKRRKRHQGKQKRAIKIPNRVMIDKRTMKCNNRKEFGHFEVDTAISRQNKKSLAVIHERLSRITFISKLKEKTSDELKNAVINKLKIFTKKLRKSITFDNGTENAGHQEIGKRLKMKTYFCNPYHSWEKGSVEHIIGRIRFFLPKKTDFNKISNSKIRKIEDWLNHRPRKVLNYLTPIEWLKYALRT